MTSVSELVEAAARRLLNFDHYHSGNFPETPVACHEVNADGILMHVNRAACELLGYREAQMAGYPIWQFLPPDARETCRMDVLRKLRGGKILAPYERIYLRRSGGPVTVETREMMVYNEDRKLVGMRSFLHDTTTPTTRERAAAKKMEELTRSNAELEQFALTVAHDLQEPLRAVAGYVRLIAQRYADGDDADVEQFLNFAIEGATHMQDLIDGVLAYSRAREIESGASAFVSSSGALDGALSNLQAAIRESGAMVRQGRLPEVSAGETELLQVFQNLIGNAIKYRSAKAPEIEVNCEETGEGWRFSVRDNGIGIDRNEVSRVFEPFHRLHGSRAGAGVGLAISKRIVERLGGRIWVTTPPEGGAAFYFTIPKVACLQHV
jgi:PAS domain S-box-containing protein